MDTKGKRGLCVIRDYRERDSSLELQQKLRQEQVYLKFLEVI